MKSLRKKTYIILSCIYIYIYISSILYLQLSACTHPGRPFCSSVPAIDKRHIETPLLLASMCLLSKNSTYDSCGSYWLTINYRSVYRSYGRWLCLHDLWLKPTGSLKRGSGRAKFKASLEETSTGRPACRWQNFGTSQVCASSRCTLLVKLRRARGK